MDIIDFQEARNKRSVKIKEMREKKEISCERIFIIQEKISEAIKCLAQIKALIGSG